MKSSHYPWEKNEQGFLILLVFSAFIGISILFFSFIMPIIFAVVITCASYPLYKYLLIKTKSENFSSFLSCLLMLLIIVFPVSYIIAAGSNTVYDVYQNNQYQIKNFNSAELEKIKTKVISYIPVSEEKQTYISSKIDENVKIIYEKARNFGFKSSKAIIDNFIYVIFFFSFSLFSMFFFYKGGNDIVNKIKKISPLNDDFDDLIFKELYSLCGILTLSVFIMAIIQGLLFSFVSYFLDLNWFFIGIAIAIASFIPIFGTAIVWFPLFVYLFSTGLWFESFSILFIGFFINGILIDNILRPIITGKISNYFKKTGSNDFNPLDNTYIMILSNLGGVIVFGIVGLFLGPIIVSISLAIFDLYIKRIEYSYPKVEEKSVNKVDHDSLNNKENLEIIDNKQVDVGNESVDVVKDSFEFIDDEFNLDDDLDNK